MSIWQNSKAVLLRRKAFEHDFCGTGAVISIRGGSKAVAWLKTL